MKIIISHDVDHLYVSDHIFRDLILEKFWVRSFAQVLQKKINLRTFGNRISLLFHNRMNRIDELIEYDTVHKIPSIFFFAMDKALGMSYSQEQAVSFIKKVMDCGLDVGVHGVDYLDKNKIQKEHDDFKRIAGIETFGVRNHYVRFDETTFDKMNSAGYLFDSTWFNKENIELRAPYKVGNMWEFPLHIMDCYACFPWKLDEGICDTIKIIKQAEAEGMPYCTILCHDTVFNERYEPYLKEWYIKVVEYCKNVGYEFISYREAIKELEKKEVVEYEGKA